MYASQLKQEEEDEADYYSTLGESEKRAYIRRKERALEVAERKAKREKAKEEALSDTEEEDSVESYSSCDSDELDQHDEGMPIHATQAVTDGSEDLTSTEEDVDGEDLM